jgi:exosortase/archaeosortase family protein
MLGSTMAGGGRTAARPEAVPVPRWPAWVWVALPALALAPAWAWNVARWLDRSDDPLGVAALCALAAWAVRERGRLTEAPRPVWLWASLVLGALALVGPGVPPLARGVAAVLSVCAALGAVRQAGQPLLAATGLGILVLPLLSSLQFFVGYPLRVVTAEASRHLLALGGLAAERSGSALTVAGRLVIVDAPCSGIQMAWMAYFAACLAAAWLRLPDRRFLLRLPAVGLAVLAGNILRNTVLVAREAAGPAASAGLHEAVGAAVFAGVCLFVMWHMSRAAPAMPSAAAVSAAATPTARAPAGYLPWQVLAVLGWIALAVLGWSARADAASGKAAASAVEWPVMLDGRPLRPLALSSVEQRFADRFPGRIGRFAAGESVIVLRRVEAPTRMLHPAADCYRGLGYGIAAIGLERRADGILQRCFVAERNGVRIRVCEHIADAEGRIFTDTSAWYWAAALGRSHGPWMAVTTARTL